MCRLILGILTEATTRKEVNQKCFLDRNDSAHYLCKGQIYRITDLLASFSLGRGGGGGVAADVPVL